MRLEGGLSSITPTFVTMVNLPYREPVRSGSSSRTTPRNFLGSRVSRRDSLVHTEPKGLLELEELARRTVVLMERFTPKSEHNFDRAMDLLRLQYNLNFMILCENCRGPHNNDELLAPER